LIVPRRAVRSTGPITPGLDPEGEAEAGALIEANRKIEPIKLVRETTHLWLKEAKDLGERI